MKWNVRETRINLMMLILIMKMLLPKLVPVVSS